MKFDIGECGNAGAKALGELLCTNTTLKRLGLAQNQIEDSGAQELLFGLRCNSTLVYLDVRSQKKPLGPGCDPQDARLSAPLSDAVVRSLQELVEQNRTEPAAAAARAADARREGYVDFVQSASQAEPTATGQVHAITRSTDI